MRDALRVRWYVRICEVFSKKEKLSEYRAEVEEAAAPASQSPPPLSVSRSIKRLPEIYRCRAMIIFPSL